MHCEDCWAQVVRGVSWVARRVRLDARQAHAALSGGVVLLWNVLLLLQNVVCTNVFWTNLHHVDLKTYWTCKKRCTVSSSMIAVHVTMYVFMLCCSQLVRGACRNKSSNLPTTISSLFLVHSVSTSQLTAIFIAMVVARGVAHDCLVVCRNVSAGWM